MKKILCIVSEHGYWGEELVGPVEQLQKAGYEIDFATPTGKRAHALPPSMDSSYVDPPLGRPVVSKEMAEKVKKIDSSTLLDNPISIEEKMPERPYLSRENYLRDLENYGERLNETHSWTDEYEALLMVGGSGPIVDMVNNQRVHDIILSFYNKEKPIAAECYAVTCLAFARSFEERTSIIRGKNVTGHPLEYDYKNGTGFLGTDFNMGPPPYPLEYILRDATGPEGKYHGNVGKVTSVIVDYPFITSRSTASSYACGKMLVDCLENGLRRYGW